MASKVSIQEESTKERQENELLSIASIFPKEVFDLRKNDVWKNWRPLELQITLAPEGSMTINKEINVQVDLYVKCTEDYPNVLPEIDIRNAKGISNGNAAELKSQLISHARSILGKEMILELVDITKTYLHAHNKPQFKSFHDEMMFNEQKLLKEVAEKERQAQEELEKIGEEESLAIAARIKFIKHNRRKCSSQQYSPPIVVSDLNLKSCAIKNQIFTCDGTCRTIPKLKFTCGVAKNITVSYQTCLSHNKKGYVIYMGLDTDDNLVIVTKWSLHWVSSGNHKAEDYLKIREEQKFYIEKLCEIEKEFKTLCKLKHENLVHYLGMTYIKEKECISVFIAQEFVHGCTLSSLFQNIPLNIQQVQIYSKGILLALDYLHKKGIVHKNLRTSSIFIDKNSCIRLSNYSIKKRLYDLNRSFTKEEEEHDPYPPTIGKEGQKNDIYRFAVVILLLHLGHLSPEPFLALPECLSSAFKNFLEQCLEHDVHKRWSADMLLSHPFLSFSSTSSLTKINDKIKQDKKEEVFPLVFDNETVPCSRVKNEFDILKHLGSGAFGKVLEARNKLDGRTYALKCIPLNPSNKHLNRKIKREVKLLSRLNHENIVRYYNSWIESTFLSNNDISECDKTDSVIDDYNTSEKYSEKSAIKSSVQWSDKQVDVSSSEEEDESDEFGISIFGVNKPFITEPDLSNDSSSIVFENAVNEKNEDCILNCTSDQNTSCQNSKKKQYQPKIKQYMYIQMEFCEKSTLRTAIDNGVFKEMPRVWRLFREIIEGLHHIHEQGMIHRDLKPANIFLDSSDRVKIGDFGLATTDIISRNGLLDSSVAGNVNYNANYRYSKSDTVYDEIQTGNVGTALYLAPELACTTPKFGYDQKVDLYSLGIIFFEMCHPPIETAMERVKIIMNLRLPEIIFSCSTKHFSKEIIQILKWLLQHDASKRPSSAELLASDVLPPLLMEETELKSILQNTVSNPQSRTYKHMINTLFSQKVRTEYEVTYDIDIYKSQLLKNKQNQVFSNVVYSLNKIVRKHGAIYLSVPLLMPKSAIYERDSCVHLMDHGGGIVTLPHDLRVPFARHIARKEVNLIKRFTIEKVYREQKVFGCHPREQYEYAFDIVTPTPCAFMPDAEIISTVGEIISEFSSLQYRNYYIRLNHVSLIKGVLKYFGIDSELEISIYEILGKLKNMKSLKSQLGEKLLSVGLCEEICENLCRFLEFEDSIEKVKNLFQPLLKRKVVVGSVIQRTLKELQNIVDHARLFGVKLNIVICPGLAHEVKLFSGMIFQFVCEPKKFKHKEVLDVLAAGGRYDKLIQSFKIKALLDTGKEINHSAVGVSIAVERIVAAELELGENQSSGIADVLVHSIGDSCMIKEKIHLLQKLWSLGISATTMYDKNITLDDAELFCRDNKIPHIFLFKDLDPQHVKVRSVEKDKVTERRVSISEIDDHIPKLCTKVQTDSYQRTRTGSTSVSSGNSNSVPIKIKILSEDKIHNSRKRELQIITQVTPFLQSISGRQWEVLAVDLNMNVLGTVISVWDINGKADAIFSSFAQVFDKHHRQKKYLTELRDEIHDIKIKRPNAMIVIYSLIQSNFKVLM